MPYITSLRLYRADDGDYQPSTFFRLLTRLSHVQHVCGGEGRSIPKVSLEALVDQRQGAFFPTNLYCPARSRVQTLPTTSHWLRILWMQFEYVIDHQRELSVNPAQDADNYIPSRGLDELSIAFRISSWDYADCSSSTSESAALCSSQ